MNSYSNVGTLQAQIGSLFNAGDFMGYLNRAVERLIGSGLWKGTIGYASFPTVNEFFALPYPFLAVIGANWFRAPVPLFSQMHDFIAGGPGQPILGLPPQGIIEDLGDGYATSADPPSLGSTLSLTSSNPSDNGKVWRVFGTVDGVEIFDSSGQGINLVVGTPSTQTFDFVSALQIPLAADGSSTMLGLATLNSVFGGVSTSIGTYYPNQTFAQFRRYRIGVTSAANTQVPNAVTVLVRRRYMPVFKATDFVIPGNIGAVCLAMQAIDSESCREIDVAKGLWDQCYAILNQELHATRGSVRPEMNYEGLGAGAGFGQVW